MIIELWRFILVQYIYLPRLRTLRKPAELIVFTAHSMAVRYCRALWDTLLHSSVLELCRMLPTTANRACAVGLMTRGFAWHCWVANTASGSRQGKMMKTKARNEHMILVYRSSILHNLIVTSCQDVAPIWYNFYWTTFVTVRCTNNVVLECWCNVQHSYAAGRSSGCKG